MHYYRQQSFPGQLPTRRSEYIIKQPSVKKGTQNKTDKTDLLVTAIDCNSIQRRALDGKRNSALGWIPNRKHRDTLRDLGVTQSYPPAC